MSVPPGASRVRAFDHLRVLATVGVVTIHAATWVAVRAADEATAWSDYTVANAYTSAGRFAVNCFFMMSGALLLAPERRFRAGRQIARVGVPLLVWTIAYVAANALLARAGQPVVGASGDEDVTGFGQALTAVWEAPVAYPLWFVYVLLGIYLLVPLLRPVTELPAERRDRLLAWLLVLVAAFSVLPRFLSRTWDEAPRLYGSFVDVLPSAYLGVFVLGFVLFRHRPPGGAWTAGAMTLAGYAWVFLAVQRQTTGGDGDTWGWVNTLPPVLLFSSGAYLLALAVLERPGPAWGFTELFSRLSFRIFLVHALVLHYVRSMSPLADWYVREPLVGIPVVVLVTVAGSFAIAWALELVRPVRRWV